MNICLSERVIILQVGIQLRPGELFSRRTPTNKLPVSYKYPQTFVRASPASPVGQMKIVVYKLTKYLRRYFYYDEPSHFSISKYVTCPKYNIFLKLLWKYFQFKFRKFCLSFINTIFEFQNRKYTSNQLSNILIPWILECKCSSTKCTFQNCHFKE